MRPITIGGAVLAAGALLLAGCTSGGDDNSDRQATAGGSQAPAAAAAAATDATKKANQAILSDTARYPFDNTEDFANADKDLIAPCPVGKIMSETDPQKVVWDPQAFDFALSGEAPDTVNPALWRQSSLTARCGLYKVADGIYQVRGVDVANLTAVRGETGWILMDLTISKEQAEVALKMIQDNVEELPVKAVVYSHTHADHFGGIRGVVDEADVASGDVEIIGPGEPADFVQESVSENVLAGTVMSRRAGYQFGNFIPASPTGSVGIGLASKIGSGSIGLLAPTRGVTADTDEITVDGIKFQTLYTPATEAPEEFVAYLPKWKALWTAEIASHTMHNILTPRGAKVRDALVWTQSLNEMLAKWGDDVEVDFASHNWPTWGNEAVVKRIGSMRDMYRYLHDETVRLMNTGEVSEDIANQIQLPDALMQSWGNHGFYGALKMGARAVYQYYLGVFDGVPAHLDPLPTTEAAAKYVEYMGGAGDVLDKARDDYDAGNYRWVAEVVNRVVFADPNNGEAKQLLADAYTQLGYQAESGVWRSFYLTGATEVLNGVNSNLPTPQSASPDVVRSMDMSLVLDYVGVLLKHKEVAEAGIATKVRLTLPDIDESHVVEISNGVLNHYAGGEDVEVDGEITVNKADLVGALLTGQGAALFGEGGKAKSSGDISGFTSALGMLDKFNFWFNISTP